MPLYAFLLVAGVLPPADAGDTLANGEAFGRGRLLGWYGGKRGGGKRRGRHRFSGEVEFAVAQKPGTCGDGRCEFPETMASCMADCPGVTTQPTCGEEPHSDPGGYAVVWGASHKKTSASECCDACTAHAADPKNSKRPCNSWVSSTTLDLWVGKGFL